MSTVPVRRTSQGAPEYTEERPQARRRSRGRRTSRSARGLRAVYFGLASLWGFVVGAASLAAILALGGQAPRLEGFTLLWLIPLAGVALAGGLVVAAAYRESRRRRSRMG